MVLEREEIVGVKVSIVLGIGEHTQGGGGDKATGRLNLLLRHKSPTRTLDTTLSAAQRLSQNNLSGTSTTDPPVCSRIVLLLDDPYVRFSGFPAVCTAPSTAAGLVQEAAAEPDPEPGTQCWLLRAGVANSWLG